MQPPPAISWECCSALLSPVRLVGESAHARFCQILPAASLQAVVGHTSSVLPVALLTCWTSRSSWSRLRTSPQPKLPDSRSQKRPGAATTATEFKGSLIHQRRCWD